MKRILLAGPAVEPVSLSEAKAHMRVDTADEDTLISTLIVAARVAAEAEIRRVMISQRWRAFIDAWPADGIELPVQPALSVEMVRAVDGEGVSTVLAAEDYAFDIADGTLDLINPIAGTDHYEVDFTAGYGATGTDVPEPLRQAILMLATHWFEHRSAVTDIDDGARTPLGYRELVAPYRRMTLC